MQKPNDYPDLITPYAYPGLQKVRLKAGHAKRLQKRNQWVEQIIDYVTEGSSLDRGYMFKTSNQETLLARRIIMHLCKFFLDMTEEQITKELKLYGFDRDRSTVNYGLSRLRLQSLTSKRIAEIVKGYEDWAREQFKK